MSHRGFRKGGLELQRLGWGQWELGTGLWFTAGRGIGDLSRALFYWILEGRVYLHGTGTGGCINNASRMCDLLGSDGEGSTTAVICCRQSRPPTPTPHKVLQNMNKVKTHCTCNKVSFSGSSL